MGKKAYIGVSDKARTVKNIYVGVGDKARKVVKGYVGVNGVARQFWPSRNPWNDYAGKKLVFDYDYQNGVTYTRNHASIEETIRWAIEKTIFYNRGIDYEGFLDILEAKKEEIVAYTVNQLQPSDNCVFFATSLSSAFHNITFYAYVGHQNASTIEIGNKNDGESYPLFYYDTSDQAAEGKSRIYTMVKVLSDGTLQKQTQAYERGLSHSLGNDVDDVFETTWGIVIQNNIINTGVHFENFNSGDLVAYWDFTQSLYDTVEQLVGCRDLIWGDSTIDNSGLHLSLGDVIEVPSWIVRYANTFEMTIGDYEINQTYLNGTMFWFNKNAACLAYYESDGYWKFVDNTVWSSTLEESTGITDVNFFKNSRIKIHYDENGIIKLYKNDVLQYTTHSVKMTLTARCGSPARFCVNIAGTVTRLRFYNE